MTSIPDSFVEEQVEELKEREDVKAMAIFGSYARNPEGEHNDLDIYIIVKGDWRKRVTEEIKGIVVEKFFNSKDWAETYLEDAKDEEEWAYPYRWFSNPDIRYDPEGIFEDLRKEAERFREEKIEEEIDKERILYNIWDFKQDLSRIDDVGQKRYVMYKIFDYLLTQTYRLKDEVPVKDNYKIQKLEEFDGYMYKLAQEFLNSSSTYEKEEKLEKMLEHVTRGMGEPSPEYETEKQFLD